MNADYVMADRLVARYAQWDYIINTSTSGPQVTLALRALGEIKAQAQALWEAITEADVLVPDAAERLAEAQETGVLAVVNELRNLDVDSIQLSLPDTRLFEHRGVHA